MSWRRGFMGEFGNRFAWLVRNNRQSVVVGLIKLVNAVWFAGLWQAGLAVSLPLLLWLVFFTVTMVIAFRLDKQNSSVSNKGEK